MFNLEFVFVGDTVDGSEIPFPTTIWMYKTCRKSWDQLIANLNWLAGFQPSTEFYGLGPLVVHTVDGRNPKQPPGMYKTL